MNFVFRTIQFGFMHIWPLLVLFFAGATLPAQDLGIIAIVMSIATLFRPLVGFSLGRTTLRFAGEAHARDGDAGLEAAVGLSLRLGGILSVLSLLVAVPVMLQMNKFYGMNADGLSLMYGIVFLYFFGITEFFDGVLRSVGRFRGLALGVTISRLIGIALFSVLLPIFPSLANMLLFLALSEIACVVLLFRSLHGVIKSKYFNRESLFSPQARKLLGYALPVILNSISVYLYARVMVLIVGIFAPTEDVGAFEMAAQITNLPMAATIIAASVLSPVIGKLVHRGPEGLAEANLIASYGASFTVWINVMAAIFLCFVAPFIMMAAFPQLGALPLVLALISPLVAIKAVAQFVSGEIAIATGVASMAAKITIVFGVLTVAVGFGLSSQFGVMGGALALLLTHTGAVIATDRLLKPKTGLTLTYRIRETLLGAVIVSVPTVGTVAVLYNSPAMAGILGSVVFFVTFFGMIVIGIKRKSALVEPLLDGLRMMKSKSAAGKSTHSVVAAKFPTAGQDPAAAQDAILFYCNEVAPEAYAFWTQGTGDAAAIAWQDHADMIYTFRFLDRMQDLSHTAARGYLDLIAKSALYGRSLGDQPADKAPNAHLTAYILSSAWLVEQFTPARLPQSAFVGWDISKIVNPDTLAPLYPKAWAHHIWRVSHWIGGGPSILFNLARWGRIDGLDLAKVQKVLDATERDLMDAKTDLLRPYKSRILQWGFRKLYRMNHDPDIADIGGVVHILWIHHALGRPYRNRVPLLEQSKKHMNDNAPFMEDVPYCLDFDIVQLVRTAATPSDLDPATKARAEKMVQDTADYLARIPEQGYTLHKVPGALATMHEAALLAGATEVAGIGVAPIDIIKEAGWL